MDIPSKPPSSILPVKDVKEFTSKETVIKDTEELWAQTGIEYLQAWNVGVELGKKYNVSEMKYSFITGAIHSIFEQIKHQVNQEPDLSERQRKQAIVSRLYDGMTNQISILKELNISIDESVIPPILHGYITAQLLCKNYDHKDKYKEENNSS